MSTIGGAATNALHVGIDCLVLGGRPSGVERAVLGLLQGLAELAPGGMRFGALVAAGQEEALPRSAAIAPIVAPGWAAGRAGRVFYEQALAPARLRAAGVELLHGAAYVTPVGWEGPSVVTIHDVITVSRPEWCAWHNVVHYRMAMTYSARRADAVIAPSEFAGREVVEHLGVDAGRVHVAPLGVNARFRPATAAEITRVRERYRLPERYLLCVGNVEPRKNLAAVVAAFERLPEEFPHALVIAGKRGWKCTEACRAMEHSSRAGRIRRLGWVAEEDLPALYSGADLLVQWSRHEGFGLTPLEAMACGTVAVVSDAGALPETAGEAAAVVPLAAGPEGLAAEIARLLRSESERGERSARGAEHAARYTWERHARIVVAVYEEVAGGA